jgi:hypothetical protein
MNSLCGLNSGFFYVKAGGIYSKFFVLNGELFSSELLYLFIISLILATYSAYVFLLVFITHLSKFRNQMLNFVYEVLKLFYRDMKL